MNFRLDKSKVFCPEVRLSSSIPAVTIILSVERLDNSALCVTFKLDKLLFRTARV